MDFIISITDEDSLAGLTWAREQYNKTLPKDEKGQIIGELLEDQDYIQFVMDSATASYAEQKDRVESEATRIETRLAKAKAK